MEFNFRRNNHTYMPYSSSPRANSFFTEYAVRGGVIYGDDMRTDHMINDPFEVRMMVEREIEKERIREEILAEIARKRALESELRQEILMEREFLVSRMAPAYPLMMPMDQPYSRRVDEGSSSSLGVASARVYDTMPFQRHPCAERTEVKPLPLDKKGPLLILPKPNSNDSGTKRIAETPAGGRASDDLHGVGVKRKTPEWSCALCQVSATSKQGLQDHLQGKRHKSKEGKSKEAELRFTKTRTKLIVKNKATKNGKKKGKKKRKF